MKRSLWKQNLTKNWCPAWPCPICRKESIKLVPKSLIYKETVNSKRAYNHEAWDPEWIEYTFTAWAECKHQSCKQQFAIAGVGGVSPEQTEDGFEWEDYFAPRICQPMPDMLDFPTKCPDDIKEELRASFGVFWSHQAACAGRIRVSVECLMNHLGIPKRKKDKNGKYFDLSLHARIDGFAKTEPNVGPHLMALKWLGNAGSHNGEVRKDDLLDAFEIMEHALVEIIDKRSAKVAALAKKLTKKHSR
jgi:hypothetical protein